MPPVKQDQRRFYYFFGVALREKGNQLQGDCPLCGKENHFFVYNGPVVGKKSPGMYDCKVCGSSGNHYTFLKDLTKVGEANTPESAYERLGEHRDIHPSVLRHAGLFMAPYTSTWYIPCRNAKKSVANLYKVEDKTNCLLKEGAKGKLAILSSPAPCKHHLYLGHTVTKEHKAVYVCEGHWDTLVVLDGISRSQERNGKLVPRARPDFSNPLMKTYAVVGVPGANTLKPEWCRLFTGKQVYLLYDNDEAGIKGQEKAIEKIRENSEPESLHKFIWKQTGE